MVAANIASILSQNIAKKLFPPNHQLLPNLDDTYELELAFYENRFLNEKDLIRNSAYFACINDVYTRHFLMCTGKPLKLPIHSSSRLKSFFEKNLFRTGYATHGLFPYRGKFHPQMIKGLLNVMGLKHGDTVLDPMMGSATVPVEACLMGINAIGIDASPFCRFMGQTKIDSLTMPLSRARKALINYEDVFEYFRKQVGKPVIGSKTQKKALTKGFMKIMETASEYIAKKEKGKLSDREKDFSTTYNFLLLAYLDSAGYSERSQRKSPIEHFSAVLERYLFVVEKIQKVLSGVEAELGTTELIEGDARSLSLEDESIDGILFSPPYSFAIDYLKNDSFHLEFFGVNIDVLRKTMVGLRGKKLPEKFELYKKDMNTILSECSRVLKKGRICTIIVGTNNNQLGKVLGLPPDKVQGLHETILYRGTQHNLKHIRTMSRPITGVYNTMRREYILMMQRK